jgi:hypothetical protein
MAHGCMVLDRMRRLASFRGNLLGSAVAVAMLAAGALTVAAASAAAAGPPSSANSTISLSPNPMLLSEPDGSPFFEATVTVKDADGDPVSGDPVTLAVTDGGLSGGMLGSISENPQETDSDGKATFRFTCNAGYCSAGAALEVTASDSSGLSLEPVIEYVGEIEFAGRSYTGQPDTLEIQGLGGEATETNSKPVTLSLNSSLVKPFGPCETDSTGSLPAPGNAGACTFTVPPFPGKTPPASIPAVVTVGAQTFDVTFPLQPAPALALKPASGPAGSTVVVGGTGFPQQTGVTVLVRFTPHGSGTESAGANCQTNGLGGIYDEATGGGCQFTIPADSPEGAGEISAEEYDSLTDFATATATFTVEPPRVVGIEISDNYPDCPGGPPAGPACGTGAHDELYVGETADLAILSVWNTGTIELLKVPAGETDPKVSWSTEPQPSGAIALGGVNAAGNDIGLTANKVTSAAGFVQVEYDGFKATSLPLSAVVKPCDQCFSVNGALLNVKAQVSGFPSSTPVAGATADITQGEAGKGGVTGPPPCIPQEVNGVKSCSDTGYEHLPDSATETCTTEAAGACELIAEEGTPGESSFVEDTVTLTAPSGYSVTGVNGCHEVTGSTEAPVCHLDLTEFNAPETITFELKPWPELTVNVGGPEVPNPGGLFPTAQWGNKEVENAAVTFTPIDGTPGSPGPCYVSGAEESVILGGEGGKKASCSRSLQPGTYHVSVGPTIEPPFKTYGNVEVTSADPETVVVKAGEQKSITFNTAYEAGLTVKVGGPISPWAPTIWANEEVDGALVTITQEGQTNPTATCRVGGGEETEGVLAVFGIANGTQAYCTVTAAELPPGTYEVSVGPVVKTANFGNAFVTSTNPEKVTIKPGDHTSVSFNTALEPNGLTNTASATSDDPFTSATASDGPLSATGETGMGTVSVAQYGSDPVESPAFRGSGKYIDVFLSPGNTFESLSFTDCELGGGTSVQWWNPEGASISTYPYHAGQWEAVSNETSPSGNPSCITVTITGTTKPDLGQMIGTVFGVALPPASTSTSTSTSPSSTTPPATTAAIGSVSLDGSSIPVQSSGAAAVKLACTGTATCGGKLTLTAETKGKTTTKGKGKGKKQAKSETIGTAGFSIPAGKTATVELTLNAAGKALLKGAHGKLSATLTIVKSSPSPSKTQSASVHLAQQKTKKGRGT